MKELAAGGLAEAQRAKRELRRILADAPAYCGIGITVVGERYAVKVNFRGSPVGVELPEELDGVPVVIDIVDGVEPL